MKTNKALLLQKQLHTFLFVLVSLTMGLLLKKKAEKHPRYKTY